MNNSQIGKSLVIVYGGGTINKWHFFCKIQRSQCRHVIKFSNGRALYVEGALIAEGTETDKIYFTSTKDDNVGGDSNEAYCCRVLTLVARAVSGTRVAG